MNCDAHQKRSYNRSQLRQDIQYLCWFAPSRRIETTINQTLRNLLAVSAS